MIFFGQLHCFLSDYGSVLTHCFGCWFTGSSRPFWSSPLWSLFVIYFMSVHKYLNLFFFGWMIWVILLVKMMLLLKTEYVCQCVGYLKNSRWRHLSFVSTPKLYLILCVLLGSSGSGCFVGCWFERRNASYDCL